MINLDEAFSFLNKNNLTFEELGILLTVYYRNISLDISDKARIYYNKKSIYNDLKQKRLVPLEYVTIVENLIEKGFIEDYRSDHEKDLSNTKIMLNKLKVSQSFTDIYFVKEEDAYEYAKSLFPVWGNIIDKTGKLTQYNTQTIDHNKYRAYFYVTLLKNGQKELFDEFCYITKEIFAYQEEFDHEGNMIGGRASVEAPCKFDKYLDSYKDYKRKWDEDNSISTNNQNYFI